MAKKTSSKTKTGKGASKFVKKEASTGKKSTKSGRKKLSPASLPHHDYENRIINFVRTMGEDVEKIIIALKIDDDNRTNSGGMDLLIGDLITEMETGLPTQGEHDGQIEKALFQIAKQNDKYKIYTNPGTTPGPINPADTHEMRVLKLFTTINSSCREIGALLQYTPPKDDQPKPPNPGDDLTPYIKEMVKNTQQVVFAI